MNTARQQFRATRPRIQPLFFGEVLDQHNSSLGFIGPSFNIVKSAKSRLALHTKDQDDWDRVAKLPRGTRLKIQRCEFNPTRR